MSTNYAGLIASLVIGVATIGGLGYFVVRGENDVDEDDNLKRIRDTYDDEVENDDEDRNVEDENRIIKKHRKSIKQRSSKRGQSRKNALQI
jgi:hypothetical protein